MNAMIEESGKWFIWTKKGRPPRFAHDDEASALAEAQRLAFKFPGKKFHVMKSVVKISVEAQEATGSEPSEAAA